MKEVVRQRALAEHLLGVLTGKLDLEVLDAQRTANSSELILIRNRQSLLGADVDLMTALGGGWNPAETTAAE